MQQIVAFGEQGSRPLCGGSEVVPEGQRESRGLRVVWGRAVGGVRARCQGM